MEYCYSGMESLWYWSWNRLVCPKGKCTADRHSRSTGVNPSRKQRCCSPSCLWSQAQRDTSDPDNSQSLGYWLTIRHRCICMWSWTEMLIFSFQLRAKTVWIPLEFRIRLDKKGKRGKYYYAYLFLCLLFLFYPKSRRLFPKQRIPVLFQTKAPNLWSCLKLLYNLDVYW